MEVCFGFTFLLAWGACGYLGYYVAMQKRREPAEGIVLGLVFGPIGAVIVALLPTGDVRPRASSTRRSSSTPSSAPKGSPLDDLGLPPDPTSAPAPQGWTLGGPIDDGPAPQGIKDLRL